MRLTLRTLLSYLDDTLEPAAARDIGEKVARSEMTPELIDRIAKVTRRRGIAAPSVAGEGDVATDPNTIAEYLDNVLPADQVTELEQAALNSDAHLAEIAACHQILTLVLGEPAHIPPTARKRMYRLVRGKESNPYRRHSADASIAGVEGPAEVDDGADFEEPPLLSIGDRRLLPTLGVAAGILLMLAGVFYYALPGPKPLPTSGYVALAYPAPDVELKKKGPTAAKEKKPEEGPKVVVEEKKPDETPKVVVEEKKKEPTEKPKDDLAKQDEPELLPAPREAGGQQLAGPADKPSGERREIGKLDTRESLLLRKARQTRDWERVAPKKDVFSTDSLLSLPGLRNDVVLDSGVRLALFGNMPEYHGIDPLDLLESRVTLNVPPIGFDADFTLESGRVFITRPAAKDQKFEPARVRVRFKEEIWDVTLLDPDTEVCFDLFGYYDEGVPFSPEPGGPAPTTDVFFAVLNGRAGLKVKFKEFAELVAPTRVVWESSGPQQIEPRRINDADLVWWSKTVRENEFTKQLQLAANHYATRFSKPDNDTRLDVAFYSAMQDAKEIPARRVYAARSLQALDGIGYLAQALGDDIQPLRRTAIRSIQHWAGLAPEHDLMLYRVLVNEKNYSDAQAKNVMQLLHPFGPDDYKNPGIIAALFEAMKNEQIAVRELAYKHLEYADREGAKEAGFFDAAAPAAQRDAVLQKWKASWKRRFEK